MKNNLAYRGIIFAVAIYATVGLTYAAPASKLQHAQKAKTSKTTANPNPIAVAGGMDRTPAEAGRQSDALTDTGQNLLAYGQLEDAEGNFRQAVKLNSENPDALCGLAQTLEQEGKNAEAIFMYRVLLSPKPNWGTSMEDDPSLRMHFAMLLAQNNQWPEAVRVYESTIGSVRLGSSFPTLNVHFMPDSPQPQQLTAMAYLALGIEHTLKMEHSEAVREYAEAQRLQPSAAVVNYYYGYGLQRVKRKAEAKAAYAQASRLGQGDVKAAADEALKGL